MFMSGCNFLKVNQAEGKFFPLHACTTVSLLDTDHQWPQGDVQVLAISHVPQAGWGPHLCLIFCGQHKHRQPGGVGAISARRLYVVHFKIMSPEERKRKGPCARKRSVYAIFFFCLFINTRMGRTFAHQFGLITAERVGRLIIVRLNCDLWPIFILSIVEKDGKHPLTHSHPPTYSHTHTHTELSVSISFLFIWHSAYLSPWCSSDWQVACWPSVDFAVVSASRRGFSSVSRSTPPLHPPPPPAPPPSAPLWCRCLAQEESPWQRGIRPG